jgi:hypothetical protein
VHEFFKIYHIFLFGCKKEPSTLKSVCFQLGCLSPIESELRQE